MDSAHRAEVMELHQTDPFAALWSETLKTLLYFFQMDGKNIIQGSARFCGFMTHRQHSLVPQLGKGNQ